MHGQETVEETHSKFQAEVRGRLASPLQRGFCVFVFLLAYCVLHVTIDWRHVIAHADFLFNFELRLVLIMMYVGRTAAIHMNSRTT
jgi:hypothetical protein